MFCSETIVGEIIVKSPIWITRRLYATTLTACSARTSPGWRRRASCAPLGQTRLRAYHIILHYIVLNDMILVVCSYVIECYYNLYYKLNSIYYMSNVGRNVCVEDALGWLRLGWLRQVYAYFKANARIQVQPAAVRCDTVLHQAFRATCTKNGIDGEVLLSFVESSFRTPPLDSRNSMKDRRACKMLWHLVSTLTYVCVRVCIYIYIERERERLLKWYISK